MRKNPTAAELREKGIRFTDTGTKHVPVVTETVKNGTKRGRSVVNPDNPKFAQDPLKKPKKNKYGNREVIIGDIRYPSRKEATICENLKLRQKAGEISDLKFQVSFPLKCNRVEINGEMVNLGWMIFRKYVADAVYMENGNKVVLDVKGYRTAAFKRQVRLMKLVYNVDVLEV